MPPLKGTKKVNSSSQSINEQKNLLTSNKSGYSTAMNNTKMSVELETKTQGLNS